jgi:hypothetical protein
MMKLMSVMVMGFLVIHTYECTVVDPIVLFSYFILVSVKAYSMIAKVSPRAKGKGSNEE